MMSNYFNTTKKRDVARIVMFLISSSLIFFSYVSINENYNELYKIQRVNNGLNVVDYEISNNINYDIIPNRTLVLQREITYSLLEIMGNLFLLALLYAGRINIEGTNKV